MPGSERKEVSQDKIAELERERELQRQDREAGQRIESIAQCFCGNKIFLNRPQRWTQPMILVVLRQACSRKYHASWESVEL